jgi:hypothetical protein
MRSKTAAATLILLALMLGWQHFHGGVPAHHLLADPSLPAISNWWGLAVLPALAWFLAGRIERRAARPGAAHGYLKGLIGAALFGGAIALFFALGRPDLCQFVFLALLPLALLVPVYRAECVLGFVLSMSPVFGPVLPVLVCAVLAIVAYALYHGVRLIAATFRRLVRPAR